MMTILPKCRRCGGAFYPDPFPGSYRHNYCDDCVDIAAAESLERMKETYIQPTPRYRWKPFYERYPNWREMIAD